MLEPPVDISNEQIADCLRSAYNLTVKDIVFLALGADVSTAVYRIIADNNASYFLKLRRGPFCQVSVEMIHWLSELGIGHLIPPCVTESGSLWVQAKS